MVLKSEKPSAPAGIPSLVWLVRKQVILAGLSLFALTAHLLFLGILPNHWAQNESTDYFSFYEPVARNLVQGNGLVTSDGSPAVRYPPGYPLILAGLIKFAQGSGLREPVVLRTFVALVATVTPMLVYGITAAVFEQGVAFVAAVLWAVYPFYLWLTKQPNSEIPFILFFFLAVYLFVRSMDFHRFAAWPGFAVGVSVGIASLVRPIALALSGALLLALWFCGRVWTKRQRRLFSVLLLFGNVLVVLPWELWAYEKTGHWVLLSTGGPPSIIDGLTFALKERDNGTTLSVSPEVRNLMQAVKDQSGQLQSTSAIATFLAKKSKSEPFAVLELILLKARRAWYANDSQSLERWIALLQAPYLLLAAVGAVVATKLGLGQRRLTLVVLLVTGYFWIMTIAALPVLRYMVAAMGLLMPFVSLALVVAGKFLYQWARKQVPDNGQRGLESI
jgi:4-amino-4-deoxy-L-arabinose transferase-like glycosyltransferase